MKEADQAGVCGCAPVRLSGGRSAVVHGDPERSALPNILSVAIPGFDSEAAIVALKDLAAISNGSACTSARYEPSHVLTAMDLPEDVVAGTVRLSWSHSTPLVPSQAIVENLGALVVGAALTLSTRGFGHRRARVAS